MESIQAIEWSPEWSIGAPTPQVFSNGQKVYLIYSIAAREKESFREVITFEKDEVHKELLALVEFDGNTFRFGIANDEVFSGLPLYRLGLHEPANIVNNSGWIKELMEIHSVHPRYIERNWIDLKHFVLLFKDEILEVVASDYSIEIFSGSYAQLGLEIIKRMNQS